MLTNHELKSEFPETLGLASQPALSSIDSGPKLVANVANFSRDQRQQRRQRRLRREYSASRNIGGWKVSLW